MELPVVKPEEHSHEHAGGLSIPAELQARMLAEFARDGKDREIAWGLFGRRHEGFSIFCAVRCEKSESATACEFDHEKLLGAGEKLEALFGDVDLLGIAHSHPSGTGFPSANLPSPSDQVADMAWLKANDEDAGVFGIVSGGAVHWFILERQFGTYAVVQARHESVPAWKKWQEAVDV
jgi:hypothetical protein